MTLLDRFRATPGPKHADPAVRLAYVEELPIDEREALVAFAREDEDPRVRRAAVSKLLDPSALAAVARDERDEAVRGLAIEMLRDIALETFEGIGEGDAVAAVDALQDEKALAHIARNAAREAVAARAVSRVTDTRALGSIARHAAAEGVRRAAIASLRDHHEILAVALNSDFKDSGVAAVDRLTAREDLEQVAARAKNKAAAKRAKGLIREMDDRLAAEREPDEPVAPQPPAHDLAPEQPVPAPPPVVAEAAAPDARAAEPAGTAADAEAEQQRQQREATERSRLDAVRLVASKDVERRKLRLAELVQEAAAAADEIDLTAARRRMTLARREWKDLAAGLSVDAELAAQFAAAETRFTTRDHEAHEAEARTRREVLARLQRLAARAVALAARPDLTLKAGERVLRDVRAALADTPPLPSRRDHDELAHDFKTVLTTLTGRVQELREADDWRRFGNVAVQEQLCAKMEALRALEDPEAVARSIRDLQQQWRQAADVPRGQGEALWRRFKTAHDELWARCEAHFAAQAQARAENLAKKTALCERVEGVADSTRWIETAEAIKQAQAEWKAIGPVSRGQEKVVWERFRVACDRFFTRRRTDLLQRKAVWGENLAKKEALCQKVEALAESTDWEPAAVEIRRLQAEWRAVGPVKKSRSEALWERFRGACDRFFTRYTQRHDIARAERIAAREAICAEVEALAAASGGEPPADLVATVRGVRQRWQQEVAARGVDRERAVALEQRFQAAFDSVLRAWPAAFASTELDPTANRRRMEALVKRVEDLAGSLAGPATGAVDASPAVKLAAMLKEALAANTIGGKVDEDSKWRAAAEDVRQAQATWSRLGPVDEETRRALGDRFQKACRTITERSNRSGRAGRAGGSGR